MVGGYIEFAERKPLPEFAHLPVVFAPCKSLVAVDFSSDLCIGKQPWGGGSAFPTVHAVACVCQGPVCRYHHNVYVAMSPNPALS